MLAVVLAGCTRASVDESQARSDRTTPGAGRAQAKPKQPAQVRAVEPWRWETRKGDTNSESEPTLQVREDEIYKYAEGGYDLEGIGFVRRHDERGRASWQHSINHGQLSTVVKLAHADGRLFVALYSDYKGSFLLHALDTDTGDALWKTSVRGLGTESLVRAPADIQMRADKNRVTIYGRETQGLYIEVFDAKTGRVLSSTRPDESLASIEWQWEMPERTQFRSGPNVLDAGAGVKYEYRPRRHPDSAELLKRDAKGAETWRAEIAGQGQCGTAAMLEYDRRLYLVHYCSISSGGELYAFDSATGKRLRRDHLDGLGAISHSEYFNDIEIRLLHGHIVVFGKEAAGRYIEARHPDNSALVASQVFRDR